MDWSKQRPGPGVHRRRGPNIDEDEIVVCVYVESPGVDTWISPGAFPAGGTKLRVMEPQSYMTRVDATTTFHHPIYRDAEWAPFEAR